VGDNSGRVFPSALCHLLTKNNNHDPPTRTTASVIPRTHRYSTPRNAPSSSPTCLHILIVPSPHSHRLKAARELGVVVSRAVKKIQRTISPDTVHTATGKQIIHRHRSARSSLQARRAFCRGRTPPCYTSNYGNQNPMYEVTLRGTRAGIKRFERSLLGRLLGACHIPPRPLLAPPPQPLIPI